MPRQLPGLYWDDVKQRYFPLQSLDIPADPPVTPSSHQSDSGLSPIERRSRLTSYHALAGLRSTLRTVHRDALIQSVDPIHETDDNHSTSAIASQIQSSQISLTNKVTRSTLTPEGFLSAFQTISHNGRVWSFAGDTLGWSYSSFLDKDHDQSGIGDEWQRQFYLSSEISSIGVSSTTCVATSFGPECRIIYIPLVPPAEQDIHISRIDNRIVHDVWTADLRGSRLVLGANKQAVVIEDIAVCTSLKRLHTYSDVFALAQRENVIYAGLRNGSILRFDTRAQMSNGYPLFNTISHPTGSVTGLMHLHNHQLLASFIDGGISTYDLRFPIRTPSMTFTGNFNSYTVRLPLVTDPHEKLLFVAGQDNRIRLWSLITGGPPIHPGGTNSTSQTIFQRPFEHRVAALQVVEEREGMYLWAAAGTELCKYKLGDRSNIGIQDGSHGG